jgi:hypothetical protein
MAVAFLLLTFFPNQMQPTFDRPLGASKAASKFRI